MFSDIIKNTVLVFSLVIPILIVIIQIYRFWNMEDEYTDTIKDIAKIEKSCRKPKDSKEITFFDCEVVEGLNPNLKEKHVDPYNDFIRIKNSKVELFKLYVIVPLESYFYIVFMIGTIYAMGFFVANYLDNPIDGISLLISSIQSHWLGSIFLFAIFMHRLLIKKIEDLAYFKIKNAEGRFGQGKDKEAV